MARAKNPYPLTLPTNVPPRLYIYIPPAKPANKPEMLIAYHWYFVTLIPWASTALGLLPIALNLKPNGVYFIMTNRPIIAMTVTIKIIIVVQ